jgi:hypothetical protein
MSTDRDVTRIVRSWLDEGATALPDRVLDAVLDQVPATSQRRSLRPAWRYREMNNALKLAIAAAAVVVVALVGINLLPRSGGVGGSGQTPSPSPAPSLTASPSPSPSSAQAEFPEGPLAAGTYTIQPFSGQFGICMGQAGCTESAADNSIRVTLTVPDGWAGIGNTLWRAVENNSPPGGASLMFSRGPWLHSSERFCQPGTGAAPNISTGTTVAEFVDALVEHPDLDLTSPVDVTLGGYSGKYLELQAPANIATNQDNPEPGECAYYFVWEPGIYAQGPNHLWHIWVLDVDGVRVVVRSDTYPGTTAAVKAQLTAIVDSIQIEP